MGKLKISDRDLAQVTHLQCGWSEEDYFTYGAIYKIQIDNSGGGTTFFINDDNGKVVETGDTLFCLVDNLHEYHNVAFLGIISKPRSLEEHKSVSEDKYKLDVQIIEGSDNLKTFIKALGTNQRIVSHELDPMDGCHYITYETKLGAVRGATLEDLLWTLTYGTTVTVEERNKKTYALLGSHTFKWSLEVDSSRHEGVLAPLLECRVFNLTFSASGKIHISILK